jgi:hypothetical protein
MSGDGDEFVSGLEAWSQPADDVLFEDEGDDEETLLGFHAVAGDVDAIVPVMSKGSGVADDFIVVIPYSFWPRRLTERPIEILNCWIRTSE